MGAAESVCEYLRENKPANRFYETYEDIVDACCDAWNSLMATPDRLSTITRWECAKVS
jgi:hypothetical protein